MIRLDIAFHCSSLSTSRSMTPKAASPKAVLNHSSHQGESGGFCEVAQPDGWVTAGRDLIEAGLN